MKKAIFGIIIALWMAAAQAATALPPNELHRLAAYLSYVVVGVEAEAPDGGSIYTVGANCNECQGSGKLGDGTVVFPCEWSDGLYYCNKGKIAKRSDGDAMDYEVDEAMCEPTPERDELFEAIENAPLDFNESTVRELEYDLEQALKEVETLRQCCPDGCPNCGDPPPAADQPETTVEESSCLVDLSQTKWNWQGTSNVPISTMREHLTDEHSIDPASLDKMSREELIALHNLLHNEEVRATAPEAKASSGSGCPNGQCPTSGSSRSRSSRGFGFFRR